MITGKQLVEEYKKTIGKYTITQAIIRDLETRLALAEAKLATIP